MAHQAKLHLQHDFDSYGSTDDEKQEFNIQNSEFPIDVDNSIEVYHDFMALRFSDTSYPFDKFHVKSSFVDSNNRARNAKQPNFVPVLS
ncbi:hypothetical protein SUGI_0654250 [Cryptomeria japonica]|nr:hypothetical protein SUGI_0654250 [Cryptomeria japonica]